MAPEYVLALQAHLKEILEQVSQCLDSTLGHIVQIQVVLQELEIELDDSCESFPA